MNANRLLSVCLILLNATSVFADDVSIDRFGVRATIPRAWKSYGFRASETRFVQSWGMPKLWSELEKASISNAVSISAYQKGDITSIEDLVAYDKKRIADILESVEEISSDDKQTILRSTTKTNGVTYVTQSCYRYHNGVGYVFSFTATPGTFETNLPKFKTFLDSITHFEPLVAPRIDDKMSIIEKATAYCNFGPDRFDDAKKLLTDHLTTAPDDLQAIQLLAVIHMRSRRYAAALQLLDRIPYIAKDTLRPKVQFQKAQCHHALGKHETAKKLLQPVSGFYLGHPADEQRFDELMNSIVQAIERKAKEKN